jgi:uncharacterized protein
MTYVPRIVDTELAERLAANGAVVIEGPKACGKTRTARGQAASEVRLDVDAAARQAAELDPALILDGETPRLIDEWQIVPSVWNHVRGLVDDRGAPGQFILTGSATPRDDKTRHSGAGRFGRVRMRTMTLHECGLSSGEISLNGLLSGDESRSSAASLTVPDLVDEIVRGGWPGLRGLAVKDAAQAVRDYLEVIRRTDVPAVGERKHDPERVQAVLMSVARHTATQAKLTTIAADASGQDMPISDDVVGLYINALTRLMIVEDQPAWNVHMRSTHQLRKAATRHFVDPSLAVAALKAMPADLLKDLNYLGLLFESLVVRDLRTYAQPRGGQLFHYRDQSNLEVDAIVQAPDAWAAFEVKLNPKDVDEAAAHLLTFVERVDTSRRGEPAALGVIVSSGYGYVRDDGVHVIPIGSVAP